MQLWQRSFYDRVIRDDQELCMIRKYISENPLRHMEENGQ